MGTPPDLWVLRQDNLLNNPPTMEPATTEQSRQGLPVLECLVRIVLIPIRRTRVLRIEYRYARSLPTINKARNGSKRVTSRSELSGGPEPDRCLPCIRIDGCHRLNLLSPLKLVGLINAQSVYPEDSDILTSA
jgi:hypothetical protein